MLDVELVYLLGELVLLNCLCSWHGQWEAALEVLHFVHFSVPRTPEKTRTKGLLNHSCWTAWWWTFSDLFVSLMSDCTYYKQSFNAAYVFSFFFHFFFFLPLLHFPTNKKFSWTRGKGLIMLRWTCSLGWRWTLISSWLWAASSGRWNNWTPEYSKWYDPILLLRSQYKTQVK